MSSKTTRHIITAYAMLFRGALQELAKNDPLRMAGATAFFTLFALPPILLILTQILGLIFRGYSINNQLFKRLAGIIGKSSTQEVIDILNGFRSMAENWLVTIGGFIFLIFVATTLFKVIKNSLNQIWKIRVVKKATISFALRSRFRSVVVIIFTGLLFIIGLVTESMQAFLIDYIDEATPLLASFFNSAISYIISLVMVTLWFAILFRYLPDGRLNWLAVMVGGFVTSLLFNIGKLFIRWLLMKSNINNIYGASGSVILLLLFVFYSSLILYYGAAFTKVWAEYKGKKIRPLPHAVHYHVAFDKQE